MTGTQLTIEQAIERQRATVGAILKETDEQGANLDRVSKRIGKHVLAFCDTLGVGESFHGDDLYKFVSEALKPKKVAHGSVDRILRDLRQSGELDYRIVNRRQSLYEITEIRNGRTDPELAVRASTP